MKRTKYKLLLVEDDESLGYLLSEYLKIRGFEILWAKTGLNALKQIELSSLDLAILDVMLPDIDGFELANKIAANYPNLPFIFLTARSLKVDVLKGFSTGAADYLKKPIDEEELVTRIEVLLSRLVPKKTESDKITEVHQIGIYKFNSKNQELVCDRESVRLTGRENELLTYLVQNKNNLCSHKDILNIFWGKSDYFNRKSLNVFISHLRKYLRHDPNISIENLHRKGFILKVEESLNCDSRKK